MLKKLSIAFMASVSMSALGAIYDIDPQANQPIKLNTTSNEIVLNIPENPTTGYQWQVISASAGIQVGQPTFTPSEQPCCGAPGVERFEVTLNESFQRVGQIKLVSVRSWEKADQPQSLTIEIVKK